MIRIAVVEDQPKDRELLLKYLGRYQQDQGCELQIRQFCDGEDIVCGYQPEYDIILMDIQMKNMDGMTAAERIRQLDGSVIFIFITQLAQYAVRGYAVEALDYLLKPVSYYALSARMDRAVKRIRENDFRYLMVPVRGGMQKVDAGQIRYAESHGHGLTLHMEGGDLEVSSTMARLEESLRPYGFSRCNKGYLLNLAFVDGVRDGCAILGSEKLLISRGRKSTFLKDLTDYIGRQTK